MTRRTASNLPARVRSLCETAGNGSDVEEDATMAHELSRPIQVVAVVGLGTMGAGIAEVMARHGLDVIAVEADEGRVALGRGHVEQSTSRAVARGKLSEAEQQALIGRIRFTSALE